MLATGLLSTPGCTTSSAERAFSGDMRGDDSAGHAPPLEAHQLATVVLGDRGELDVLTGGLVEERSQPPARDIDLGVVT
jgi:hypothetical protein